MSRSTAIEIFTAGLDAVRGDRLIGDRVSVTDGRFVVDDWSAELKDFERVLIVGGGKAVEPMATAIVDVLAGRLPISGWINVPGEQSRRIVGDAAEVHVHGARPIGINQPTEAVLEGTDKIIDLVDAADSRTLVIALITGGGSALLCRPKKGFSLSRYIDQTNRLADAGGDIETINRRRREMDDVKAGGLARRVFAASDPPPTFISFLISDVIGDPLAIIASGPTVCDDVAGADFFTNRHFVLGNNAVAVDAAGIKAESLRFNHLMHCVTGDQGSAEACGRSLARLLMDLHDQGDGRLHDAVITGGEPTVTLCPPEIRGRGGRNGQLVLAAYLEVIRSRAEFPAITLLSGGTDGEDGTSDSAGAVIDRDIHRRIVEMGLDAEAFLRCNNSHEFFDRVGGLVRTGPTGTNVCDVRVGLVGR